jgi:bile acid-coenzyme A ligase
MTIADPSLELEPVVRILRRLAEERPDAQAITCGAETITRAELEARSNRLARAYIGLGVGLGDFVTIGVPNSIEFYVVMLAAWKVGAVPQPVSHRLPAAERSAIVELADSKLVVGVPEGEHSGRASVPAGYQPDTTLEASPLPEVVSPALRAPTSGGSTGRPKLIVTGARAETIATAGGLISRCSRRTCSSFPVRCTTTRRSAFRPPDC